MYEIMLPDFTLDNHPSCHCCDSHYQISDKLQLLMQKPIESNGFFITSKWLLVMDVHPPEVRNNRRGEKVSNNSSLHNCHGLVVKNGDLS